MNAGRSVGGADVGDDRDAPVADRDGSGLEPLLVTPADRHRRALGRQRRRRREPQPRRRGRHRRPLARNPEIHPRTVDNPTGSVVRHEHDDAAALHPHGRARSRGLGGFDEAGRLGRVDRTAPSPRHLDLEIERLPPHVGHHVQTRQVPRQRARRSRRVGRTRHAEPFDPVAPPRRFARHDRVGGAERDEAADEGLVGEKVIAPGPVDPRRLVVLVVRVVVAVLGTLVQKSMENIQFQLIWWWYMVSTTSR